MIYFELLFSLFIAQLAYFRLADHFNIIDKPNERSSHTQLTLRGGGIIFYLGYLFYFFFDGFQYPWFTLGLTLISAISFADDIKPRSPKFRLLVHFTAMAFLFYQCGLFFLPWYFWFLGFVLCTGILNAYNFMDGINGITGLYSTVVLVALWYINSFYFNFIDNNLIFSVLLALVVFNFFNFRKKAKCFAGDVGAISIAFIIIFLIGKLIIETMDFSFIILLAVYGVDSILTIVHRLMLRENIFDAHRKHLYQLMANELKIPQLFVSSIYAGLQLIVVLGMFVFKDYSYIYLITVILFLSVVYVLVIKRYFYLHLK